MRGTLLHRMRGGDDGIGLVLVLGMGAILTGLMIISTTAAIHSLSSSREHVSFESALAAADGGIDVGLARAQETYLELGTDSYTIPATTGPCVDTPVAVPAGWATTPPTPTQERDWARAELELLADVSGCLQTAENGQYVLLKPTNRQVVYSMAWSPSRSATEVKQRMLKAEYLFVPYAPSHAILTGGDLLLGSSTTVTTAGTHDPLLAAVHTNGALMVDTGNPSVTGPVTQGGPGPYDSSNNFDGNTGDAVIGAPLQSIPFPGARSFWAGNHASNPPGGWYDLCPDGRVRSPNGASPCAGTVLANVSSGGSYRGWSYNGSGTVPVWSGGSEIKQNGYSGTYYVSEGDVLNPASNSGAKVPNLTVIASAVLDPEGTDLTCNKTGGNITWGSTDPAAPSIPNTWLIADQDLLTESNYEAGSASAGTVVSGLFIAGDQVEMQTSSNGAYGAVIAVDDCDPASGSLVGQNYIKNPSIYYDPNAQAPFTDIINNTLWLEYAG